MRITMKAKKKGNIVVTEIRRGNQCYGKIKKLKV